MGPDNGLVPPGNKALPATNMAIPCDYLCCKFCFPATSKDINFIPGVVDLNPCDGDRQYAHSDDIADMAEYADQGLQTELTMEYIAKIEDQATKIRVLFE